MSLESKYSLRDEYYGSVEDPDMTVNEEDVAELCKMEIWTVKNIIRLDTSRIGTAFDKMMDAVKVRLRPPRRDVCPREAPYRIPSRVCDDLCTIDMLAQTKTLLHVPAVQCRLSLPSLDYLR